MEFKDQITKDTQEQMDKAVQSNVDNVQDEPKALTDVKDTTEKQGIADWIAKHRKEVIGTLTVVGVAIGGAVAYALSKSNGEESVEDDFESFE